MHPSRLLHACPHGGFFLLRCRYSVPPALSFSFRRTSSCLVLLERLLPQTAGHVLHSLQSETRHLSSTFSLSSNSRISNFCLTVKKAKMISTTNRTRAVTVTPRTNPTTRRKKAEKRHVTGRVTRPPDPLEKEKKEGGTKEKERKAEESEKQKRKRLESPGGSEPSFLLCTHPRRLNLTDASMSLATRVSREAWLNTPLDVHFLLLGE